MTLKGRVSALGLGPALVLGAAACGGSSIEAPAPIVEPSAPPASLAPVEVAPAVRAWVDALDRASESREPKDLIARYAPGARVLHWGEPPSTAQEHAESLTDGPDRRYVVRVMASGQRAVVEWVMTGEHPVRTWGMRGASVIELTPEGLVAKETLYDDYATPNGQVGGGYRHCLPTRQPPPTPTAPPIFFAGADDASAARKLERWIVGPPASGASPVNVSNQFLAEDETALYGTAPELAKAIDIAPERTTVSGCFGSDVLAVCAVERRARFVAPLFGVRPTRKEAALHFLVIGELDGGNLKRVVEYGGAEFRDLLTLDGAGFLSPEDAPSCRP